MKKRFYKSEWVDYDFIYQDGGGDNYPRCDNKLETNDGEEHFGLECLELPEDDYRALNFDHFHEK